jgi:prolipoprotein diacylglyceryltransferase
LDLQEVFIRFTVRLTASPNLLLFFVITGALALLLPPAVMAAHANGWLSVVPSFLYETTWLVTFATVIIYVYLSRWAKGGMFVQMYLLSMVVKLLEIGKAHV